MPHSLTRRRFVGSSAAAAAGAAIPSVAWAERSKASGARKVDVVIVGASLSGLAAAHRLVSQGASVAVLEARDRVGGRTWTVQRKGTFIDIGAQFIGPTQTRITAVAKAMGVKSFKPFKSGENLFDFQGKVSRWTTVPPLRQQALFEYAAAQHALEQMSEQVPADAPYDAPSAKAWDWQTFQSWLDENVASPGARTLLKLEFYGNAVQPGEASLLTSLRGMQTSPHSEQPETSRFVGGAQQISERLAARLGSRVFLSAAVRSLKHSGGSVVVDSAAGRFEGERAIVALAPTLALRIAYDPPLPMLRDGWTQHVAQGSVIKCQAIYRTPFWRQQGLSGHAISNEPPLFLTFDNGPPPPADRPGVLLGFVMPGTTRHLAQRRAAARRQIVLQAFARLFGSQALTPIDYVEGNWSTEPWTRGCYGGVPAPGAWVGFGRAYRAPVGRIHWAATETALRWPGYMDGAVGAGEAAADQVLSNLGAVATNS
jgi:monoamine oxidase